MYVTQIDKEFEGDVFFPKINEHVWEVVEEKGLVDEESKLNFSYITYERKNNQYINFK